MKFRSVLICAFLSILALLYAVGGNLLLTYTQGKVMEEARQKHKEDVRSAVEDIYSYSSYPIKTAKEEAFYEQMYQEGNWYAMTVIPEQDTLYSMGNTVPSARPQDGYITRTLQNGTVTVLQTAVSIPITDREIILVAESSLEPALFTIRRYRNLYWVFYALTLIIGSLVSFWISNLVNAPLERLLQSSQSLAQGSYTELPACSIEELDGLSESFNTMAQTIQEKEASLLEAVERQSRFTAAFAHEVKTPVTSMIGYGDLIRSGVLSLQEITEGATVISQSGKRLESLSQKLMELFVTEEELQLVPSSPGDLILELAEELIPLYEKQNIALEAETTDGTHPLEPDLFRSLMSNLLENARRAIDGPGKIHISQSWEDGICIITIQDTGRGIPPEDLPHLTEAFYRVDKSRSRKEGGAGLGLFLCAKILELHNGSLKFDSTLGKGTTVRITIGGPCQ